MYVLYTAGGGAPRILGRVCTYWYVLCYIILVDVSDCWRNNLHELSCLTVSRCKCSPALESPRRGDAYTIHSANKKPQHEVLCAYRYPGRVAHAAAGYRQIRLQQCWACSAVDE